MNAWNEKITLNVAYNSRLNERTDAIQEYLKTIFTAITEIAVY